MKKFLLVSALTICALSYSAYAKVDMSKPLIVEGNVFELTKPLRNYTYLKIEDFKEQPGVLISSKKLEISKGQNFHKRSLDLIDGRYMLMDHYEIPAITNDTVYIGRDIHIPYFSRSSQSVEIEYYEFLPFENKYPFSKLIFGKNVKYLPTETKREYIGTNNTAYGPEYKYKNVTTNTLFFNPLSEDLTVRLECIVLEHIFDSNLWNVTTEGTTFPEVKNLEIGPDCTKFPGSYFDKVEKVICEAMTPPEISYPFPTDVYESAQLYVPYGMTATYLEAEGWKRFENVKELPYDPTSIDVISGDEMPNMTINAGSLIISGEIKEEIRIYTADGRKIYSGRDSSITLPKGILIVRYGSNARKLFNP